METTIIIKEAPAAIATKKEINEAAKSKPRNFGFYAKKRCITLYVAIIAGVALLLASNFLLGATLIFFASGILFLLKDLDEAMTLDLNFNPKDQTNNKIKEDLNF